MHPDSVQDSGNIILNNDPVQWDHVIVWIELALCVGNLPCFQIRDDGPRRSNQIGEERRLVRETNPENEVAVERVVDRTPRLSTSSVDNK